MSGFERNSNWRNYRLGFQLRLTQEQSSVDKLQGGPFLKKPGQITTYFTASI